jgi:hypothetical protein
MGGRPLIASGKGSPDQHDLKYYAPTLHASLLTTEPGDPNFNQNKQKILMEGVHDKLLRRQLPCAMESRNTIETIWGIKCNRH